MLWAAAVLQLQPPHWIAWRLRLRVRQLVAAGAAGRVRRIGHLTSTVRSCAHLQLQLPGRLWARWQACLGAQQQLQRLRSHEVADVLTALAVARQGKVDARWLDRLLTAAGPQLPHFPPKQLSATLWALGTLQHTPPRPWLLQLLSSSYQQLPHFTPGQISQVIWGLAELDTTPSPLWLSAFWSKSGQTLDKCDAQQLLTTAAAVAKLRLRPPGISAVVGRSQTEAATTRSGVSWWRLAWFDGGCQAGSKEAGQAGGDCYNTVIMTGG
ncbi:hypothetical protein OEZ85_004533 [Tetradesmus obliquus]|uniref:FAST kinase leucine-rich domain-containing protein n=1 Tax=Tetradesmus obliquus TaxID=3088 RepID=A0ABY8ULP0_TETOB|nr:hypothetical protein OEZ85_004533 [Tetradesmus obliquus]